MKALVLSNGKLEVKEINNTLEELQKIVDGYIEMPFLSEVFAENDIDVVINEEGKFIEGLKPEIAIVKNGTNQVLDVVMGNCIFVSHNEKGDTTELNDEQIRVVAEELEMIAEITMDGKSHLVKVLFI